MSQVTLVINGHSHTVGCEPGQEEHLRRMARAVSDRVEELVASMGQVGEARLLLMACLTIADELYETQQQLDESPQSVEGKMEGGASEPSLSDTKIMEDLLLPMAKRLEAIAEKLEQA